LLFLKNDLQLSSPHWILQDLQYRSYVQRSRFALAQTGKAKRGSFKIKNFLLNDNWRGALIIIKENVTGFRCINKKLDSGGKAVHRTYGCLNLNLILGTH
jgi:hypothetical protein